MDWVKCVNLVKDVEGDTLRSFNIKGSQRMVYAEIVERIFTYFQYLITLCQYITFPLMTKFKSNWSLSFIYVNRIPN